MRLRVAQKIYWHRGEGRYNARQEAEATRVVDRLLSTKAFNYIM